jgi:uncharacterized membrane protein YsdA (DUF1294 family)
MEQWIVTVITVYIITMSITGFTVMGIDKRKSQKKAWRIPERTLLLIAILGGGIGSLLGMHTFRHKTRHFRFLLTFPLTAGLDVLLLMWMYHLV